MALKPFSLVIQGGGTRASFCLGVIEAFLKDDLQAEYVIGTSAGALIGLMYLIGQPKKGEEAFLDYMSSKQFVGLSNVIRKGALFNFSFFYEDLNQNHKEIDMSRFFKSKAEYYAVATDCLNGEAAYFSKSHPDILKGIEASCALPLFSKPVIINGRPYLDGGTVESIPFHKPLFENKEKIVVISSRPRGFLKDMEKSHRTSRLVAKVRYNRYPEWSRAFLNSISSYNKEVTSLRSLELEGRVYVIYPPNDYSLGVAETDLMKLKKAIELGKRCYKEQLEGLIEYLSK